MTRMSGFGGRFAWSVLGCLLVLAVSAALAIAEDELGGREVKVGIEQVPAAVKAAILTAVGKGRLVDIGEITLEDGSKVYEIEMILDGAEYDVRFDASGKVLGREKEGAEDDGDADDDEGGENAEADEHGRREVKVGIDQVPAGVKAAILSEAAKGLLVDIGEITHEDGVKVYEIELWIGTTEYDVLFDGKGNVLAREKEGADNDDDDDDDDEEGR